MSTEQVKQEMIELGLCTESDWNKMFPPQLTYCQRVEQEVQRKEITEQKLRQIKKIGTWVGLTALGVAAVIGIGMCANGMHERERNVIAQSRSKFENIRNEVRLSAIQRFGEKCLDPQFCSQGAVDIFDAAVHDQCDGGKRDYLPCRVHPSRYENALRDVREYLRNKTTCYCLD